MMSWDILIFAIHFVLSFQTSRVNGNLLLLFFQNLQLTFRQKIHWSILSFPWVVGKALKQPDGGHRWPEAGTLMGFHSF